MELLKEMKSSLSLHPMLISIVLCLRTTVEPLKSQSPQVPAMNKAPQCEVTSLSPAMLKTKKSQSILFRQLILLSASSTFFVDVHFALALILGKLYQLDCFIRTEHTVHQQCPKSTETIFLYLTLQPHTTEPTV